MLQFLVFTIFLFSSPTFGLLENLFHTQNSCYRGCHSTYADNVYNMNACKKGCDFKLHNEYCPDQCKFLSNQEQIQASCLVGCLMIHPDIKQTNTKEHPHSIILIRLRQHRLLPYLTSKNDPIQNLNDILKQLKENPHSKEVKNLVDLTKHIETDSSKLTRVYVFQNKADSLTDHVHHIRSRWDEFIHKQPKFLVWILLSIFIFSSAMLWYMIVLLCTHSPRHHDLSIHAQEIIIDNPYDQEKLLQNQFKQL